ncbi:MAG: hypothetical protein ASARMPRED_005099 [Alectoria sarmentosa]|nr:MAG: hypothetical protein ASARMPRED_005099 [Alectoria sarmentosa]
MDGTAINVIAIAFSPRPLFQSVTDILPFFKSKRQFETNPPINKTNLQYTHVPNVATQLLTQLTRVSKSDLREDNQCIICMGPYETAPSDTEIAESAVQLPRNHLIYSECIAASLFPKKGRNNTCPCCSLQLFDLPARIPITYDEFMAEFERDAIPRPLPPLGPLDEVALAPLMHMSRTDVLGDFDIVGEGTFATGSHLRGPAPAWRRAIGSAVPRMAQRVNRNGDATDAGQLGSREGGRLETP